MKIGGILPSHSSLDYSEWQVALVVLRDISHHCRIVSLARHFLSLVEALVYREVKMSAVMNRDLYTFMRREVERAYRVPEKEIGARWNLERAEVSQFSPPIRGVK